MVVRLLNLINILDKYQNFTMGRGKKERSIKNKIKVPHIWQQSPREVNNLVDRRFYFRHISIMFIISLIANDKFTNPFRRTILQLLWVLPVTLQLSKTWMAIIKPILSKFDIFYITQMLLLFLYSPFASKCDFVHTFFVIMDYMITGYVIINICKFIINKI